jgi:serine/threonine protein phosphatase PrpC
VGSDGLFDVIEQPEIVEVTLKYANKPQQLAHVLVDFALQKWTQKYTTPTNLSQKADNTTVVVVNLQSYFQQFNSEMSPSSVV